MIFVDVFGILLLFHIIGDFFVCSPWAVSCSIYKQTNNEFSFLHHLIIYSSMVVFSLFIIEYGILGLSGFQPIFIVIGLFLILLHFVLDLFTIRYSNPKIIMSNSSKNKFFEKFNLIPFPLKKREIEYDNLLKISVRIILYNQFLLLIFIIISYYIISTTYLPTTIITNDYGKYALVISMYLLCLTPSTAFIKRVLLIFIKAYELEIVKRPISSYLLGRGISKSRSQYYNKESQNYHTHYRKKCTMTMQAESTLDIGKYFGWVEMVLTLTLVLFNAFEAIGFLIAAKAYVNFQSYDDEFREIFVFGTLLSISIALVLGALLLFLINDPDFFKFLNISSSPPAPDYQPVPYPTGSVP